MLLKSNNFNDKTATMQVFLNCHIPFRKTNYELNTNISSLKSIAPRLIAKTYRTAPNAGDTRRLTVADR